MESQSGTTIWGILVDFHLEYATVATDRLAGVPDGNMIAAGDGPDNCLESAS